MTQPSAEPPSTRVAPAPAPSGPSDASPRRQAGSGDPVGTVITCIDYSPDQVEIEVVGDLSGFLARHRPPWSRVRWINVDGLADVAVVEAFAAKYGLHPLAIEDVLHPQERPKVEDYPGSGDQPGRLFIVARVIDEDDGRLVTDQISLFLGRTTLLTFQEDLRDDLDLVRQRIARPGSRLREYDASFLLYALLDGIVDHYFPILERFSERLAALEDDVLDRPTRQTLEGIHRVKRDLLVIRRAAWPLRDLIAQLQREKHECLSETAQTYLRDVYDHCVQIIDLVESYREIAGGLAETYVSVISNRTSDVMKVLTVIGTIFIPLTFLAGVYGMNMPIPENQSPLSYPAFWIVCLAVSGGMLLWFRRRGWI